MCKLKLLNLNPDVFENEFQVIHFINTYIVMNITSKLKQIIDTGWVKKKKLQ